MTLKLEGRENGWGGSEIAAAVGLSPYETLGDAIMRKAGLLPPVEQTWPMRWGQLCEGTIIRELNEFRGWKLTANSETLWHNGVSWAFATPDAWGVTHEGESVIVQCKSPQRKRDEQWGRDGSGDVPAHVACQVLWEMDVMRSRGLPFERAFVAARFGAGETQLFPVPWDAGRAAWLQEAAAEAWAKVLQLKQERAAQ